MSTSSPYLSFEPLQIPQGQTMSRWGVLNKAGAHLGEIRFSGAWRKYCFFPHASTQFDSSCLFEICEFLSMQTAKWREDL